MYHGQNEFRVEEKKANVRLLMYQLEMLFDSYRSYWCFDVIDVSGQELPLIKIQKKVNLPI